MSLPPAASRPPRFSVSPPGYARLLTPILLGWLAGIAAQLQQDRLWPGASYALLAASGLALLVAGFASLRPARPAKPGLPSSPRQTPASRAADFAFAAPWLALVAAMLLAYASTGLRALHLQAQALAPALEGRDIYLTGRIAAMPQRTDNGVRFLFEVESAQLFQPSQAGQTNAQSSPVNLPERLMLTWYGAWRDDNGALLEPFLQPPDLRAGERWRFNARLRAVHGARNPHGFDYELWMWEQGLQASGYVRTTRRDPAPTRLAPSPPVWNSPQGVEQARQQVRDAIVQRAPAYVPVLTLARSATASASVRSPPEFERPATRPLALGASNSEADPASDPASDQTTLSLRNAYGVVAALVTGDQQAIARADWDVFRATGVAHLMSISGLHITLFAWLAAGLIGTLWRYTPVLGPRLCLRWPASQAGLLGGLLLATAYALFSGWGVPAQRTVLMLAVVTLLRLTGRHWPWPQLWLAAAAIVLAVSPWAWLQAGFWLSFVAVGVLFANGRLDRRVPPAPDATASAGRKLLALGQRGLRPLWHLLREQGIVTLALAPLTLLFFGQMSVVSLLANLIAIPWVTLVVTPLALLGSLGVAAEPLAAYSAALWDAAAWAVQGLNHWLGVMADWPLATYSAPQAPLWAALAGVAGGLLLVLRLPWSLRLAGLPLLLPVLLWQPPTPAPGQFDLLAADVGQGQAVLVRTANHALLYDAGPRYTHESDAGERVLVPLLRALGVRLDMLVLSHRDADHAGGAAAVLTAHPQAWLLSSLDPAHELLAGRPSQRCQAGQYWEWDGVRFDILHPHATDYGLIAGRTPRANTLSCVLRIRAAAAPGERPRTALLAGDIERMQERRLVAQAAQIQGGLAADLLLVPHHGSKTSSTAGFLDTVAPHIALVQAGYRNRYGHPAPEVMARYGARGITVYESPRCGAATWRSGQPAQLRCERTADPRYWQHRF
jgi:competence protein ComEC